MEIVFGIGGLVLGLFSGLLPYLKLKDEITKLKEEGTGIVTGKQIGRAHV